jgi:hypothetical protein
MGCGDGAAMESRYPAAGSARYGPCKAAPPALSVRPA